MKRPIVYAIGAYVFVAVVTFDFAIPIDCKFSRTAAELVTCARLNVIESAWAGATWPTYWIGRAAQ
jgi:hypothetical protein